MYNINDILTFLVMFIVMIPLVLFLLFKFLDLLPNIPKTSRDYYMDKIIDYMVNKYWDDKNYDLKQIDALIEKDKYSLIYQDKKSKRCIKVSYYFDSKQIKESPYLLPYN